MPAKPAHRDRSITIFSQFSLNGVDIIDRDHLPDNYPFVWVTNAIRSDADIGKVMVTIAEHFPDSDLSVVNISHLFSNEYAMLIFYRSLEDFSTFADYLYEEYRIALRRDFSTSIVDLPKATLLQAAEKLESSLLHA